MPTDKAGVEITVGCRVAEADFTFGDGLVESITVPVQGGGFNVGVKWDDPDKGLAKGGPTWSNAEQGGGRAGEHLMVIEPQAEAAIGDGVEPVSLPLPSKREAFIARFDRSPTASEAE